MTNSNSARTINVDNLARPTLDRLAGIFHAVQDVFDGDREQLISWVVSEQHADRALDWAGLIRAIVTRAAPAVPNED